MPFKCCVSQCTAARAVTLHKFPPDVELFKTWCEVIGRPDLRAKGLELIQKYYRVCDLHFDEDSKFLQYHNCTNLKVGSIPSVNLPEGPHFVLDTKSETAQPVVQQIQPLCKLGPVTFDLDAPSTSTGVTTNIQGGDTLQEMEVMEHSKSSGVKVSSLLRKRNLLHEVNLRKRSQLTPKAAKLYKIATEYKNIAKHLDLIFTQCKTALEPTSRF